MQTCIELITHITSGDGLLWACYSTEKADTYSTINPTCLVLVKFRLIHPSVFHRHAPKNSRRWDEPFDINKHPHRYELEVHDPAFRFGRKVILFVSAEPGEPFYEVLRELHIKLQKKVKVVNKEHKFSSQFSGVADALAHFNSIGKNG